MKKPFFTSLLAIIAVMAFTSVASPTSTRDVRQRPARVRKKVKKEAVSYVCPMHADMRSKSRGECPKCGMELVRASEQNRPRMTRMNTQIR